MNRFFMIVLCCCCFDDIYSQTSTGGNKIERGCNSGEIYLTADFCPSRKAGYDKKLFDALIELSKQRQKPVPVGLAVSGRWILSHLNELEEIKSIEKSNYIKITWINHGYAHFYDSKAELAHNFMLHDKKSAKRDIEMNDSLMLANGLVPSGFFRFPGLISDSYLDSLTNSLGYKVLGASAWLAKTGGKFKGGDIILLHGNLNEPKGIELFIRNIQNNAFEGFEFAPVKNLSTELELQPTQQNKKKK